jgi:pilus assembly protein CpaE
MPVLVEPDSQRAAAMAAMLSDGAHVVASLDHLDSWLQGRPDEYAVIVGPQVNLREASAFADRLRTTHPSAGLVLVRHELTTEVFNSAMHAGIPAVVAEDDASALRSAVDRARQTWEAIHGPALGGSGGKVLTVFSPKGGVGKTTLATNLAVAMAGRTGARVALVDVDAYFGDVAITMGLEAERTLPDLLEAYAGGQEVDLERYLVRHPSGVYVLPARHTGNVEATPRADAIASLLRKLAGSFDFLIVDTPGTFGPQVAAALDESTTALLVTSADMASVKDARMSLTALQREGFDEDRLKLVVNHATNANSVTDGDLARAVGYDIFWTFPHDRAVPTSTQRGEPLVLLQPKARMAQEVQALAAHIGGTAVRESGGGGGLGWFRRR